MKVKTKMHKKHKNQYEFYVKVQSKIHNQIYHTILIDLYCYEKIPKEKEFKLQNKQ